MNNKESRAFLRGELEFTPQRMMRYIRSRARLATDEDIEDILQNALVLVSTHYDPSRPDAKLAPYCLSACNKAIAQNLERYHKIALKKRSEQDLTQEAEPATNPAYATPVPREESLDASGMNLQTLAPAKSFKEEPSTTSQYRTTSLDSLFDAQDNRDAFELFDVEYSVLRSGKESNDPACRILLNDLIDQVLEQLPTPTHRTCFLLKYVEGFKREDLIECLKMDAKSIDTVDKKIVRTLKALKEKFDKDN
jgi:DNA-directed RNA polymerase specialized sigma24 family protein